MAHEALVVVLAEQKRRQTRTLNSTYVIVIGMFLLAGLAAVLTPPAKSAAGLAQFPGVATTPRALGGGAILTDSNGFTTNPARPGNAAAPVVVDPPAEETAPSWPWSDWVNPFTGKKFSAPPEPQLSQDSDGSQPYPQRDFAPGDEYLDPAILPAPMQTAIPEGARILKPPPVIIHQQPYTGRTERCPQSAGDAVRLFGGNLKQWTKAMVGWTMISPDPVLVNVPEGMSAGYLIFIERPEFYSVLGPVTIENINFLAISCE